MNTDTQTHPGPLKHRLFVAVPLFTLCFAVSIGFSMKAALVLQNPAVVEVQSEEGMLLESGIAVSGNMTLVESGSVLQMLRGSGLFAASSLLRVHTQQFTISSWNGAIELSVAEDHMIVAALSAPALVRSADSVWIVPAGMQMRIVAGGAVFSDNLTGWIAERMPLPLPAHYLATRLPLAEQLLAVSTHSYVVDTPVLPPLLGQALRLEQSRTIAQQRDAAYRVTMLGAALAARNTLEAQTLLLDERTMNALRSDAGTKALPNLLRDALDQDLASVLLPVFAEDSDMHAIAAYHPKLRAHAWVITRSAEHAQDSLSALINLPVSDRSNEPLPSVAVEQWGEEWSALLSESDLTGIITAAALPRLEADILALDVAGFPERSRLYAQTVVAAFMPHMDSVDTHIIRLQEFAAGAMPVTSDVEVIEEVIAPEPIEPPEDLPLEPEAAMELEAHVRSLMQAKNAMFTSKSAFTAQTATRVLIENLVLGTLTGDKLLSFTLDPQSMTVVDIEKDGKILPYSLPLDQYLEWVGK